MLISYRLQGKLTMNTLANKLGISLSTLKNWERNRTHPTRKFWPAIRGLF
jgi:DNA-binding transcriptional regulator YiaG